MTAMAGLYAGNVRAVLERGFKVIGNQNWTILVSGFFEPVFYLLAMGYGLGGMVGQVSGPNGTPMSYLSFIAPALLATSAMNGAIYDSTWNVFFKMKFARIYEAMLSTSLGPLDVAAGEVVSLVGGSGSGKTTLLRQIVGLLQPAEGEVQLFGEPLFAGNRHEQKLRRRRFAMCFQQGALFKDTHNFAHVISAGKIRCF